MRTSGTEQTCTISVTLTGVEDHHSLITTLASSSPWDKGVPSSWQQHRPELSAEEPLEGEHAVSPALHCQSNRGPNSTQQLSVKAAGAVQRQLAEWFICLKPSPFASTAEKRTTTKHAANNKGGVGKKLLFFLADAQLNPDLLREVLQLFCSASYHKLGSEKTDILMCSAFQSASREKPSHLLSSGSNVTCDPGIRASR